MQQSFDLVYIHTMDIIICLPVLTLLWCIKILTLMVFWGLFRPQRPTYVCTGSQYKAELGVTD